MSAPQPSRNPAPQAAPTLATYLGLAATAALWGSAFALSKLVAQAAPPPVAALVRFGLGAAAASALVCLLPPPARRLPRGAWPAAVLLGLTGVALYNLFFFWGLALGRASDGSMVIPTLAPIFTALLAALLLGERLPWHRAAGIAVAALGAAVFFAGTLRAPLGAGQRLLGNLLFLGSALSWAAATLLGRGPLRQVHPLVSTAYSLWAGAAGLALAALPHLGRVHWRSLGAGFWLTQLYLAVGPTALAQWFYYRGVQHLGAARAAAFMYLVPPTGLVLAAWLLGDTPTGVQVAGGGLMLAGVWLTNRHR